MRVRWQSQIWKVAPPVLLLAAGCGLAAQGSRTDRQEPHRGVAQGSPAATVSAAGQSAKLERLMAMVRDHSSLLRVQALESIDNSATFETEAVDRIFAEALDDADPMVAEAALGALLHRGEEQVRLVRESDLLKHPGEASELVRVRIAARNQDAAALTELMRNGNAAVQASAFEALAMMDAPMAVEALRMEFLDAASLQRLQSLELFLRSPYANTSRALMPVLEAASRDEDPLVRARAKEALREREKAAAAAGSAGSNR